MNKPNNLYNYKSPKSANEETHFLLTNGRISLKAFLLRLLFAFILMSLSNIAYFFYALEKYNYWLSRGNGVIRNADFANSFHLFKQFNFIVCPLLLLAFIFIQGVKRLHDVNKSGWFIFIPFYNIVLLFTKGTVGNNDYGIDPKLAAS